MASKHNITITLCSDEDMTNCFSAISRGFGHDAPFFDSHFPNHDTPSGQASGAKRLLAWKRGSANSSFVKAVKQTEDSGDERIIGLAVWTHMIVPPTPVLEETENVEEVWPDEEDAEYMRRMWPSYVGPRSRAVEQAGGKGVYVLELLGIDCDYQKQGAGTALVQWGTSLADKQGLEAIVEGTPLGRRTYESCGFRAEIEEISFDVGERFSNRVKPPIVFLRRPCS